MRKVLFTLLIWFVVAVVIFLISAFIEGGFDPVQWDSDASFFFVLAIVSLPTGISLLLMMDR